MLAWLATKLKRAESSQATNELSQASYRATSILSSPIHTRPDARESRQEDASTRKQHECDAENETSAPGPGALIGLGWTLELEWSGGRPAAKASRGWRRSRQLAIGDGRAPSMRLRARDGEAARGVS
jgi:hypothetical protein